MAPLVTACKRLFPLPFLVLLAATLASAGASRAEKPMAQPDISGAAAALAEAHCDVPDGVAKLWHAKDGLPAPDAQGFAARAAAFLADHPVEPPGRRGPTLWDTSDMSSRQAKCLAWLAGGERAHRDEVARLCAVQAMRMQWTLPIRTGHRRVPDRAFYAATGALALTGGLVRRGVEAHSPAWETATQWLRTGTGQLATYGARGDKPLRDPAMALAKAVRPEPGALSLQDTDEAFFAQIDLERDDMRAVAGRVAATDWEGARAAYVAALARRFAPQRGWPDIQFDKSVDLAEADDVCRNVFVLQAHMFRRYDYGDEVDWAKVIDGDIESRVWMNAHPWMWTLLNAWRKTGDEKYADALCRHFTSWHRQSPPPFRRSSAQWRTLECGGRVGQKWGVILLGLSQHPRFQRECLFTMAASALAHGKYLAMYAAGGGNWLQVESSGLACVALLFPELKLSPVFYQVAMSRLAWVNARSFLPDGFQSEGSPGYHRFPLIGIASALRLAKFLDAPVPESLMAQYEAGVEAIQFIAYPDGVLPMLSDVSPRRTPSREVLETGAEVFGRDDFRWFATGGKDGKPPAQPSHDFTHAGYCVMRDRWGPKGQVLVFDAGYFGSGHQHEDKLNVVYYAGGRELIGDPGIYSYKRDAFEPYWRGTWSHNTVVIDGLSQHRALGPGEKMPDPDRRFVIGDGFDFAVGWYRRAYSPRGSALWGAGPRDRAADRAKAIRDVHHQRIVFCVKGRYAVVCDRIVGEGEHQIDLLWHPAPVITGEGIQTRVRAVKLDVRPDRSVVTREPDCANVAILPARGTDWEVLDLIGQKDPHRGWYALYSICPSHDVVYRRRARLPVTFATVLQPLPPGDAEPMQVAPVEVTTEGGKPVVALRCGADLFLLSCDGPASMACGPVRFDGTALLLRREPTGQRRASMVDGRSLSVGAERILRADEAAPKGPIDLPDALRWPTD